MASRGWAPNRRRGCRGRVSRSLASTPLAMRVYDDDPVRDQARRISILLALAVTPSLAACGTSDDSSDAALAGSPDASDAKQLDYPAHLSETGLFTDIASETLGQGVETYTPQFT